MSEETKKKIPTFVTFEEWREHLPAEFQDKPESFWTTRSHAGRFPVFMRQMNQRDVALWRSADLLAFWRMKWSVLYPDCIQSMLDAGFEDAPESVRPARKKRRARRATP